MVKKWWHDKVAYQIYPKSFRDTNGDGIGDLRGIIQKLDYLKGLGVDIIWISPVYCSPMKDQGYDISDYYNIDPIFGTIEDMEELLAEAKKRDLYILMDLVVNHCSSQHQWFQKALQDPDGEYGRYFYIREGKDGKEPNNWRGNFGGSAWERIDGTNKYYLHTFHETQPDLNWENPAVREKIYQMINWWLEKGLAGFRIDAIINIKKELNFKDYPQDREDGTCSIRYMLEEAEGISEFLTELRENTFDKYGAFTVAEVFDNKPEELGDFIGEQGYFSTIFDFSIEVARTGNNWYEMKQLTPEEIKSIVFQSQETTQNYGFMANIIENHDEPRGASAFFTEDPHCQESKTMLGTLQVLQRGIPFIYQGQEIGMTNVDFESIDQVDDISTKDQYQVAMEAGFSPEEALRIVKQRSRDNCRTPFQWNSQKNAGFTDGNPWLMVNPNYRDINLEKQAQEEDSVYAFYKKLLHLRKEKAYKDTFVNGTFRPAYKEYKNIFGFYRELGEQQILILANYQKEPQTLLLKDTTGKVLLNNYGKLDLMGEKLCLEGYQAVVILLEK